MNFVGVVVKFNNCNFRYFCIYDQDITAYRYRRISWQHFQISGIAIYAKQFPFCISIRNLFCEHIRLLPYRVNIWIVREEPFGQFRMEDVSCSWILRWFYDILNICKRKPCSFKRRRLLSFPDVYRTECFPWHYSNLYRSYNN